MVRTIGIIGAGPAGLVAATAASQSGLNVTVFERADGHRRVGGGIAIQNNGLRVLSAIGVLDGLRPRVYEIRNVVVESTAGKRLFGFDLSRSRAPFPWMAVLLRSDLQAHLASAAEGAGAKVLFDQAVVGVSVGTREASIRLASGVEHGFDVVIGADGIRSVARDSLGLPSRMRSAERAYLRGVSTAPAREEVFREIWGTDGRRFGLAPLAGNLTYFFCSIEIGTWSRILDTGSVDRWLASWEPYGPSVVTALAAVQDWHAVNYDDVREIRLRSWTRPPVFLVGDAAHAMTPDLGQGANSAMVDALILVRLLKDAEGRDQVVEVARRYERLRRRFVGRVQSASRAVSLISGTSGFAARFPRDLVLRLQDRLPLLKRQAMMLAAGHSRRENELLGSW